MVTSGFLTQKDIDNEIVSMAWRMPCAKIGIETHTIDNLKQAYAS